MRLGKANRILAVLIYPWVKGREILVENFFIRFCFSVQRSRNVVAPVRHLVAVRVVWLHSCSGRLSAQHSFSCLLCIHTPTFQSPCSLPLSTSGSFAALPHRPHRLFDLDERSSQHRTAGKTLLASVIETTLILIHRPSFSIKPIHKIILRRCRDFHFTIQRISLMPNAPHPSELRIFELQPFNGFVTGSQR